MRIALMGRSLRPPLTGIGRYTVNLARALEEFVDPASLSLYVTRDAAAATAGLRCRVVTAPVRTPHEVARGLWEQTLVARDVALTGADVYHSPNYALPVALGCPAVLTVHDLAFLDSRFHRRRLSVYMRLATDRSVRQAARVIAVSRYTRDRIVARYPEAEGKVQVVYNGLDPLFEEQPTPSAVAAFRAKAGLTAPYVLYVGTIEPRKNIPRLVRAFESAAARLGSGVHLVICGAWGWRYEASREAIETSSLRDRIHVLGYLPAEQLPHLYAGAEALVYPSLEEGFGFPPLEAMAMGTPAIVSNTSSLPEVVAGAGIQVDPTSVDELAEAMERVLSDANLATDLAARGYERSRRFTWARAAAETLDVYRSAAESAVVV